MQFSCGGGRMEKRESLTIKVLSVHKRAIERIAEAGGEPMSVILRRLIRKEARERGLWPSVRGTMQPEEVRSCQ